MFRRAPRRVLRRVRWASVRRSCSGTRNQPVDSASDSRFRAASRSRAARSGLDQRPSMYASPPPVSPPTSRRTSAARSWISICAWSSGAAAASPNTRRVPSGRTTVRRPNRIRRAPESATRHATRSRSEPTADGRRIVSDGAVIGPPRDAGGTALRAARDAARANGSSASSCASRAGTGRASAPPIEPSMAA